MRWYPSTGDYCSCPKGREEKLWTSYRILCSLVRAGMLPRPRFPLFTPDPWRSRRVRPQVNWQAVSRLWASPVRFSARLSNASNATCVTRSIILKKLSDPMSPTWRGSSVMRLVAACGMWTASMPPSFANGSARFTCAVRPAQPWPVGVRPCEPFFPGHRRKSSCRPTLCAVCAPPSVRATCRSCSAGTR